MHTFIQNIVFDCANPFELAQFWSKLVDRPVSPEDQPGDTEVIVEMAEGPTLFFQQVPEPKTIKNRVHICLRPDTLRDDKVARVLEIGGSIVSDHRNPDGTGWAVCADPEGNEFCLLRSVGELPAGHAHP